MTHRTLPRRRPRRGATTVFVALMLISLLGVCAIAVDLSRIYVGVNELQTSVDAAALRGALFLQRSPKGNPTVTINDFMTRNSVMGATATNVTVTAWRWDTSAANRKTAGVAFGTIGDPNGVNAVQVSATLSTGMLFGRALSVVAPRPTRSAIAWVSSVGLACVRQWMFEVTPVFARAGVTVAAGQTPTADQVADLRTVAISSTGVYLMIAPPTVASPAPGIYGPALAGRWMGFDVPSGRNFQSSMNTCNATPFTFPQTVTNAASNASQNSSVVNTAENNIEYKNAANPNICPVFTPSDDDYCNVTIPVTLGYAASGTFATAGVSHSARMLTTFRLLCYKRADKGSGKNKVVTGCSANPASVDWSKVEAGTMYGYLDFSLPKFSGNYTLGTGASTAQRLILVR